MGSKSNKSKKNKVQVRPFVKLGDEKIIQEISKTILEERIDSVEKLRERFKGDVAVSAAILRNSKVVAASLALVGTPAIPVRLSSSTRR